MTFFTDVRDVNVYKEVIRKALACGKWIVYDELFKSSGKSCFRICTLAEPEWLVANLAKKRGSDELLRPDVAQALHEASQR
ncbi:hypothetical protein F5B18DRAFT_646396 [Nemania serpens]|nr:hypothetical protein F5B18DRAFT_646396 [Nemania serpens]